MRIGSSGLIVCLCAAIALFSISCGRKTDPTTPDSPRPAAVEDLSLVTRDAFAFLSWTIPARNIEGKVLSVDQLLEFRVFRATIDRSRKKPRFHQVAAIPPVNPEEAEIRNNRVYWKDGPLQYGHVYAYRVVAVSTRGGISPPSEAVRAVPLRSLAPPENLTAQAGEKFVFLNWNPVTTRADGSVYTGFVGYNVYRRVEGSAYPATPLNAEPLRTASFRDTAVENGRTYYYMVRAVDSPARPWTESLSSAEVSATPRKTTPPARPSGLTVVPGVTRVFLTWDENKEGDLAGYHVYRSLTNGKNYERLTPRPISRSTYSDESVTPGKTYYYAVTALDTTGNESAFSKQEKAYTEKIR